MYGQYYCAAYGNNSPKPNALIIPVSTFRVLVRRKWRLTQQEVLLCQPWLFFTFRTLWCVLSVSGCCFDSFISRAQMNSSYLCRSLPRVLTS